MRLAYDAALAMSQPRDIMNAVIAGLIQADFELPTLSGLAKLERRVRTVVHGRMFRRVYTALTQAQKTALDQLLTTGLNQRRRHFRPSNVDRGEPLASIWKKRLRICGGWSPSEIRARRSRKWRLP